MSMSRKLLGFHCEQKHICLQYSPSYYDGQCRVNGEHSDCECSSNFTCILGMHQYQYTGYWYTGETVYW